jgi:hypothetical protein
MGNEKMHRHHLRAIAGTGLLVIIAGLGIVWVSDQAPKKAATPAETVQSSEWKEYGSDEDGNHYYRVDATPQPSPGIIRVWSQLLFNEEGRARYIQKRQKVGFAIEGYDQLSHRNVLYEINCFSEKREICIQEVLELTKEGKTLDYAKAGTYKDWSDIPPGSIYEKLCAAVCPARNQ